MKEILKLYILLRLNLEKVSDTYKPGFLYRLFKCPHCRAVFTLKMVSAGPPIHNKKKKIKKAALKLSKLKKRINNKPKGTPIKWGIDTKSK